MPLPNKVRIVEVGPRDGLQNESEILSPEARVELILELMKCGLQHIEAGSFVHPKWIPQMADTGDVLDGLPLHSHVNFPVLVPNMVGLEKALQSGVKEIAVFSAASETFSRKNINCSIAQSIQRFEPVVEKAQSQGLKVRGYISCVIGCPYEGSINSREVVNIATTLKDMGCYEISLGDTIGCGTPLDIQNLIGALVEKINIDQLAVHFHDTYGQALANIYAALTMGISVIDNRNLLLLILPLTLFIYIKDLNLL